MSGKSYQITPGVALEVEAQDAAQMRKQGYVEAVVGGGSIHEELLALKGRVAALEARLGM
jgi:hypothetical protein